MLPEDQGSEPADLADALDPANFITIRKHPGGRPTKYDPAWCELVVELGAKGFSRAQIAADLGITRASLANYEQEHPEFLVATTSAHELSMAWFEEAGRRGMFMKGFNANAWSLQVRNRFRGEYVDENQTTHKIDDSVAGVMARIDGKRRTQTD